MNYKTKDAYGVVHIVEPWPGMGTPVGTLLCHPGIGLDQASFDKHKFNYVPDTAAVSSITCLVADPTTNIPQENR